MSQAAENLRVAPRQLAKYLAQTIIVFAAYFVAGKLGQATSNIRSSNLGPVWPAYGVALAAILLCGYRAWVGVVVAAFLVAFLSLVPLVTAVGQAAGATLAALVGSFLLLRFAKLRLSLSRLRDALALIVIGAMGSATVSATIGVVVLYAAHVHAYSGLGSAWLIYWLGDSTGVLLVTPLVLTFPDLLRIRPRARVVEFVALLLLLTVTCFIIFGDLRLIPVKLHVLAFAVLPSLMWAAIRFGVSGAALSTLFVATIATVETALGSGPFAQSNQFTNAVLLDVFFAVLSVSGMTLATVIAEREQAEREREQLVRERAAMEARLRLAIIVESSDDAIIGEDMDGIITDWNKGAERLYGYSANEVVGKSISLLVPADRAGDCAEIMEALRRGNLVKHYETVHEKQDGTRIQVSLTVSPIRDAEGRIVGASAIGRDISESKRAEDAVRESEKRYRRIVETTNEGIWLIDSKLRTSFVNRQMAQMLGYEPEEMLGQSVFDFSFPEDMDRKKRILERRRQGVREQIDERLRRQDGSELWVRIAATPIFKHNSEFDGALAMLSDITERKRAEEVLRKSEERFRLAAQAGKMYAYEWDVATDKVVRSVEYVNVLGFGDQTRQLTRQQVLATVHPEDRALFVGSVEQLTPQNPITQISYRVLHPDGWAVWLEKSARAFFDEQGKLLRMIGMVANISEHKRAEEALRDSEDKLRLLLDSTAEAIYGIDLEHRCTFCNPACLRTLGYEHVDEVLGKNMHNLLHHTRADGTLFPIEECRVHRVTRTGEGVHADDEVLWRANGTSFPAEYWSYPQLRREEVVGAVIAFVDITERKLAEAALASVSRRLIEAQDHERIRISRELHDDIGQRIALLGIGLQQLQQGPLESRGRVAELQKQTAEIAADIQSLSHELHSSKLQYLGIATAMRGFCQEFGKQQKVEIDFRADDLPNALSPDISLCFFRVLQEALHNSAKHSGVRHFEVRLWGTSDEIHLTVSDSGVGFDSEAAKASRGIGLISMEERLKLLSGTFSIESQPQRGTTVHARVPFDLFGDRRTNPHPSDLVDRIEFRG
jgi:PAS domain S-box-containing protein